ncbi:MAG TPA: AzlC family ABC transporter permease [Alphaproteobacteria bacterium]|nr:AzlC family ABC transporter permease [Alphaproteobacteria bacterium]
MSDGAGLPAAAALPPAAPSRAQLRVEVRDGLKITFPFMVGAAPFGVIFGALATAQGLHPLETAAFSLFVFSGSAQFVAISLLALGAGAWTIWLATLILNLRHTLYAAALVPYVRHLSLPWRFVLSAGLTDETFAAMEDRYRRLGRHELSHWAYLTSVVSMYLNWNFWTALGIFAGSQFKGLEDTGLGFAAIATFIGMVVQKLTTPGARAAAAIAGILAAALAFLPHNLGLTIATVAAICGAVLVDRIVASRRTA